MIWLSDLLGADVRTESEERLGHVFDVRVERVQEDAARTGGVTWRVKGLVVGRRGALERFGIPGAKEEEPIIGGDLVPWPAVLEIGDGRVLVKDGTQLE